MKGLPAVPWREHSPGSGPHVVWISESAFLQCGWMNSALLVRLDVFWYVPKDKNTMALLQLLSLV